jgi:hypothetical protein
MPTHEWGELAEWAHSHWVWLASEVANQTSETEFVEGFLKRNIPVHLYLRFVSFIFIIYLFICYLLTRARLVQVGAVDLDSQWATADNNCTEPENHKQPLC